MNHKIYNEAYSATTETLTKSARIDGYSYGTEIEQYDMMLERKEISNDSFDHISGVRAATVDYVKAHYVPMECERLSFCTEQVERLLAAIYNICAQGFSTTLEYAIDEAWGLAEDIRAEMTR